MSPLTLCAVGIGGAAGSCLRVVIGAVLPPQEGSWPWGTFAVNVVGCALLALLPAFAAVRRHGLLPPLLGTGVLGGFTTLSAWSAETHALAQAGRPALAAAYALGTLACCLAAVAAVDRFTSLAQRRSFDALEGDL